MARLTDEEIMKNSNIGTDPAVRKANFEAQVQADVEAFLAKGGQIEVLEPQHVAVKNTATVKYSTCK